MSCRNWANPYSNYSKANTWELGEVEFVAILDSKVQECQIGFVVFLLFEEMSDSPINLMTLISIGAFELLLFRLAESKQSLEGLGSKIRVFEKQQDRQLSLIFKDLLHQILAWKCNQVANGQLSNPLSDLFNIQITNVLNGFAIFEMDPQTIFIALDCIKGNAAELLWEGKRFQLFLACASHHYQILSSEQSYKVIFSNVLDLTFDEVLNPLLHNFGWSIPSVVDSIALNNKLKTRIPLDSKLAANIFSNSSINLGDDIVFAGRSLGKLDVVFGDGLAVPAPWGVELDEDVGMLLDEGSVVGVVEDDDFGVGENQEDEQDG